MGLSKAPEHIFHPTHDNGAIVKALGAHHDAIVSQYSVWAITESKDLGVNNLGIDVSNLDAYPSNIRAWTNRLIGSDHKYAIQNMQHLVRGSRDEAQEAREGLAIGIRYTYFDGLEEVTVDWLNDEGDREVRAYIIDHMATNSDRQEVYKKYVELEYTEGSLDAAARQRIEAMCEGTSMYKVLRRQSLRNQMGQLDIPMFQIGHLEVNVSKDIQITGNVQAGVISSGDNAASLGTSNAFSSHKLVAAHKLLDATAVLVKQPGISANARDEILSDIEAAKKDLTPSRLEKIVKGLSKLEAAGVASEKIIGAGKAIVDQLGQLLSGS